MNTQESAGRPDAAREAAAQRQLADERELRRQLDELGFPRPEFRDEREAPRVDEQALRALIRRELPPETAALVYRLIYSFRSWHDAHSRLIREEWSNGV